MSSRRSSFDGSFVETISDRASNSSAYQLATSLALVPSQQSGTSSRSGGKHGLFSKLKHVRIGSHAKRDSANWEWRCKGEDMENFDWPPADWSESPVEPEQVPELEPPARIGERTSSDSTTSTVSSVQTWPDEEYETPTTEKFHNLSTEDTVAKARQRQADEQAAIDALETFFASRVVSPPAPQPVSPPPTIPPIEESDWGIDLSVYEQIVEEERPSTFIEASPTPVLPLHKPKAVLPRASFLSLSSSNDDSPLLVENFPVEVVDHRPKRQLQKPAPIDTSRRFDMSASSSSLIRSAPLFATGPLPSLPSPQRRRPSSTLLHGTPLSGVSEPYSPIEIKDLSRRRSSAYKWI